MVGLLFLVGIAAATLLYLVIKPYTYWAKKHVQTGKIIPVFGDNLPIILGRESIIDLINRMYNKVPNVRYLGVYQFQTPILLLKSPELIKQICVKDFDHFLNHRTFIPDGLDELLSKNLMALKGQTWKDMRSILSPTFTSSKMKSMFILICNNANIFAQHFVQKNENVVEVELKEAYTKYTNDVIASVAFGIHVDSLKNEKNEFYVMGTDITTFAKSTWKKLVILLYQLCPKLMACLGIEIFSAKTKSFFLNLVKDTIKAREEQNIKRPDMLGLLMEARLQQKEKILDETQKSKVNNESEIKYVKSDLSDTDIASQMFIFFLGGFDIVSTAMCFMTYELAANPDVQKKLIEEIDENRHQDKPPSYETIVNMTYLDMVLSETLRKWPLNIATDRVVTKPYTIQPQLPEEKPVHLGLKDSVMIPIYALHHDPKYYSNPDKFDPERFSPENKNNIDPYAYLPFGIGPRNCIGSRFALLEIKAVLFYLLSYFEIVPVKTTQIPLVISKRGIGLAPENGFPLGLKRRN